MTNDPKSPRIPMLLWLLAGFVLLVCSALVLFRPDRPVATIEPGSSADQAFAVQIIRPRAGLPLGGLLPPELFGQEAHLGFDSTSPGTSVGAVGPGRIKLSADGWDLVLAVDAAGHVTGGAEVVFELLFQDRLRKVRCWPGDRSDRKFSTTVVIGTDGISGNFDIEFGHCVDAETGKPLGWPAKPLILHGSFDGLCESTATPRD